MVMRYYWSARDFTGLIHGGNIEVDTGEDTTEELQIVKEIIKSKLENGNIKVDWLKISKRRFDL